MKKRVKMLRGPDPEPPPRWACFGPPPLLQGEDAAAYDELLLQASTAVKPVDMIEDIWVRDVVDLSWEIFRLRRIKAALLTASASTVLYKVLGPLVDTDAGDTDAGTSDVDAETGDVDEKTEQTEQDRSLYELVEEWARRNPDAIAEVDRILSSAGLTLDVVFAEMLSENIDFVERIDHMITKAEARRNVVLREIDRHRATLGQDLRRAVQDVDNGKLQLIEAKPVKAKRPA
jgi:hypothetical protein